MNLDELIKGRRSIRSFTDQCVEPELIKELIDLAVWAPTGSNLQPWAFAVVENKELLKRWSDLAKQHHLERVGNGGIVATYKTILGKPEYHVFHNAPVLVAIYGDTRSPNYREDCTMVAYNLMLAAHSRGLGSCWIGFAVASGNLPEIKEALGVPEGFKAVSSVILGYPRDTSPARTRKEPLVTAWVT